MFPILFRSASVLTNTWLDITRTDFENTFISIEPNVQNNIFNHYDSDEAQSKETFQSKSS